MPIVFNVKIAICLIFTANTRLSSHQQSLVAVCVHLLSCPRHARVCEGWGAGGLELRKRSQTKTKQNSSCWRVNCEWDNVKNRPETADNGFLKTKPRKPSFRFLNYEVRFGSVFRKPISKIFIGFHTPLHIISVYICGTHSHPHYLKIYNFILLIYRIKQATGIVI